MRYLKFTLVDSLTKISVQTAPAENGPMHPPVAGLQFVWSRESNYPTDVPELFGTCPDGSFTTIDGVLGVFPQNEWKQMQADEMARREATRVGNINTALTALDIRTIRSLRDVLLGKGETQTPNGKTPIAIIAEIESQAAKLRTEIALKS